MPLIRPSKKQRRFASRGDKSWTVQKRAELSSLKTLIDCSNLLMEIIYVGIGIYISGGGMAGLPKSADVAN